MYQCMSVVIDRNASQPSGAVLRRHLASAASSYWQLSSARRRTSSGRFFGSGALGQFRVLFVKLGLIVRGLAFAICLYYFVNSVEQLGDAHDQRAYRRSEIRGEGKHTRRSRRRWWPGPASGTATSRAAFRLQLLDIVLCVGHCPRASSVVRFHRATPYDQL